MGLAASHSKGTKRISFFIQQNETDKENLNLIIIKMKESILNTVITAVSTLGVAALTFIGFNRFKAKSDTKVQLRELEGAEAKFIVETLKTLHAEALSQITELRTENEKLKDEIVTLKTKKEKS